MTKDFSPVARQAVRQWSDIFKVVKEEKAVNPDLSAKTNKQTNKTLKVKEE